MVKCCFYAAIMYDTNEKLDNELLKVRYFFTCQALTLLTI